MRRSQRLIAAAVVIALSGALAGCSSLSNWDPTDLLDFLDTKKKLPGERKPVFPEGVPGLEQGVPKNLYKGSAQEQIDQQNAQAAAAAAPLRRRSRNRSTLRNPRESKSAGHRRHRACSRAGSRRRAAGRGRHRRGAAGSQAQEDRAPAHHRAAARSSRRQPAQPGQSPQQSAAPFPAPMPSGTFTR